MSEHYVYALLRTDGVPFYVGMGKGRRWLRHEDRARYRKTHKDNLILEMRRQGVLVVPKVKLAEGLTSAEAHRIERDFIKRIGRTPHGPLVNHTDGGEGMSNPSPEVREKLRAASIAAALRPGARERLSALRKAEGERPGAKMKRSAAMKSAWAREDGTRGSAIAAAMLRPDVNVKLRSLRAEEAKRPGVRGQTSARSAAMWADPATRARIVAAMHKALERPATKARRAAASKRKMAARWADPDARAKLLAAIRRRNTKGKQP